MALAHLAVIYGADPRDVPLSLGRVTVPDPALARWLQDLVAVVIAQSPEAQRSN
jgi:hypothetical protein